MAWQRVTRPLSFVLMLFVLANPRPAAAKHAQSPCDGDCNYDERVTIDEVVQVLDIALGHQSPLACLGSGWHSSDEVNITDVVKAVDRALFGCNLLARFTSCDRPLRFPATSSFPQLYRPTRLMTGDFSSSESHSPGPCGCDHNTHVAWYHFTPSTTGIANVTAAATDYPLSLTSFVGPCDGLSSVACTNPRSPTPASLVFDVEEGEDYVLQAAACDSEGGVLQLALEICGDGSTTLVDECDDGNNVGGDGCSAECRFEDLTVDQRPVEGPFCNQGSAFVGIDALRPLAQEFAPSEPELAAVDVSLHAAGYPEEDTVTVTIRDASIDGAVVASSSRFLRPPRAPVSGAGPYLWQHFRFTSPIRVVPGSTYVLEVTGTNSVFTWQRGTCEYPGGNPIYAGTVREDVRHAFLFRTYTPRSTQQVEQPHAPDALKDARW